MNLLGSIVFALGGSVILSAGTGMALSMLSDETEFFVVVLLAGVILSVICVSLFAIASVRPFHKRATRRLGLTLATLLGLITFGMAAAHFGAQGSVASTWPGVRRMLVLLVCCEIVVLVQWLVFRRERPENPERVMQFGRAGATGAGERK